MNICKRKNTMLFIKIRSHNPEVVGSSPASATITDTVMDTNVSVTVSFFIPIFTPKQGDFPNFVTHLL